MGDADAAVRDPLAGEVTEVVSHLIRNACVNDGTAASGGEERSATLLAGLLDVPGVDVRTYEPSPGRRSLVASIEGTDPSAPSLCLMGHTDVVPVTPEHWTRDPFGGEVVDGEVWGRGAVDMLNITGSMGVAVARLAASGFRPRGTLVYLAVADEEALGTHGAKWLLDHERDAVRCDYLVTESGGVQMPTGRGPAVTVNVAEKGAAWARLRIEGTPGHASRPLLTDNALVKAAEVIRRVADYRPRAEIHDTWRRFVGELGLPSDVAEALLDPDRVLETCLAYEDPSRARAWHACTHTTFAPTIAHGGTKTNVIPDVVDLDIDIRTLPGQTGADVEAMLVEAIGPDLLDSVRITVVAPESATASPVDTRLWHAIERVVATLTPDARPIPGMMVGATDGRFFRRAGTVAYGFGLFSPRMSIDRWSSMFHGNDERVDVESLCLSTLLWERLAVEFLG